MQELLDEGYDILFVDLETSRDIIRKNANYVMQIIQYINGELIANESEEQIAVLGIGTGGVIGRIAVREMELQQCCHNVRMFTAMDAPHRGMNIPIGIQAFLESTTNSFSTRRTRRLESFYENVIQSPLMDELLIYNYDQSKVSTHMGFKQYMDLIGMPKTSRNFAIINGADDGKVQKDNTDVVPMQVGAPYFLLNIKAWAPLSSALSTVGS